MAGKFSFEVTERIATLSSTGAGYSTELNKVSFNGYAPKLDLRKWHNGEPLKGVTLTDEEAHNLLTALHGLEGMEV